MISRRTGIKLFVFLAIGVGIASALVWWVCPEDEILTRLQHSGVLRIGYAVEAPYAVIDDDGRVTGESPEVARLVAIKLGVHRIEWILTEFDSLLGELEDGRFDVVAAGMFITPERERIVLFSQPTLRVRAGLLVQADNPHALQSYQALIDSPDVHVAALSGSIEEARLLKRGVPATRLLSVPDAATGRAAVESGRVDALALSMPTISWMAHLSKNKLVVVSVPGRPSFQAPNVPFYTGFVFAREHRAFQRAWNRAQESVMGTPEHLKAIEPFGLGPADLPIPSPSEGASSP